MFLRKTYRELNLQDTRSGIDFSRKILLLIGHGGHVTAGNCWIGLCLDFNFQLDLIWMCIIALTAAVLTVETDRENDGVQCRCWAKIPRPVAGKTVTAH
jgi:hypothetical protein